MCVDIIIVYHVTEPLYSTLETNTSLQINYTSVKNIKKI